MDGAALARFSNSFKQYMEATPDGMGFFRQGRAERRVSSALARILGSGA